MIDSKGMEIKVLLWDFDGVIMRSNEVRDRGFELVLASYPSEQVDRLMQYHRQNGGLSRYVKFRYFFEVVRGEEITESQILELARQFSKIMMENLTDASLLIDEALNYVKKMYGRIPQFIVSGSDQEELRNLCKAMNIHDFFEGIFGSPTPKKDLVRHVLSQISHDPANCLLIGDSINDYDAAFINGIQFWAYNNPSLSAKSTVTFSLQ
jgi:phosphoglycolate phosphatase-like HAD superfamily hydrolase